MENNQSPDHEMYQKILPVFMQYMYQELEENYQKGDRTGSNGWLEVKENKYWISELYYHVGKLQSALMNDDVDRIKENCADIANLAMMLLDVKVNLLESESPNKFGIITNDQYNRLLKKYYNLKKQSDVR
jgi:hypothetical protein